MPQPLFLEPIKITIIFSWFYVGRCLDLLASLKSILVDLGSTGPGMEHQIPGPESSTAPALGPDALSVSQQQKVSAIVQLVGIMCLDRQHRSLISTMLFGNAL
jgi:hypothetical protein